MNIIFYLIPSLNFIYLNILPINLKFYNMAKASNVKFLLKNRSHNKPNENKKSSSGNQVWLYGQHAVLSALQNSERQIIKILIYQKHFEQVEEILSLQGSDKSISFKQLIKVATADDLNQILPIDSVHQGYALLTIPLPRLNLSTTLLEMSQETHYSFLILDHVTDTRNIGAIIRSAVAFKVYAIIVTKVGSPKENGLMAKSAAGGLEKIKFIEVSNLQTAIIQLKKEGFWIIGLDAGSDKSLHELQNYQRTALVLGAEDKGMRDLTQKSCDFLANIPMDIQAMESLNISVASAIALYELYKSHK
ncbi:23S rRNA (guanosine-2'-O-)-methyltransferase RlmB [Candidatus Hepatincolaceae symbiont of Richtersius coronifer]